MAEGPLDFGPYRLDARGVVWHEGEALSIGRRGVRLLEALLRRRGEVVTKAELMDAAWPDESVEESNLSVQVALLRKHIGPDWIRTVERVGYRFMDLPPTPRALVPPTLAIASFRDLGGAADAATALTDELIIVLARFSTLRIVAVPAPVGAADYVLEGSVRREGAGLHITVRLIEGRSGHYVWADRFESRGDTRPVAGLVGSTVEDHVQLAEATVSRRERPESETAPDLYRRAHLHMRASLPGSYAAAIVLLRRALEQDPLNVRYLADLCGVLGHHISMGWPSLTNSDSDLLFETAALGLRQCTRDARAMAHFGVGLFRTGDNTRGYGLLQRAAELNPNDLHILSNAGNAAMHWGSLAEAEAYFRRALCLDPVNQDYGTSLGGIARLRMIEGRYAEALALADRSYCINPFYGGTRWTLIAANALLGRDEEAARHLARFRADHPGVTTARIKDGQPSRARLSSTLEGLNRAGLD